MGEKLRFIWPHAGAFCFGGVIGWITKEILARARQVGLGQLSAVIGSVGGAAVTVIYKPDPTLFPSYCVGLAFGFFTHLLLLDPKLASVLRQDMKR